VTPLVLVQQCLLHNNPTCRPKAATNEQLNVPSIPLNSQAVLTRRQQVTPGHFYDQTHTTAHDAYGPFLKLVAPLPNRLCFKNDDAVAIICTACSALFPPGSGGSRMAIDHARKKHNSKQVHANGGIKRTPPPPPGPGPQGPNGWYGNGPNGGGMNGGGMYGGGMFHGGTFGGGMYGNGGGWV